ncbi:uncharacterized protein LOC113206998 isoform X1 [Frankliniella occidentalis]|uniref:Uncharacterized protein LOC113206998 isoform X1 n=1 Tax=Frankliniella occidentalis TaxID=133901 RepID=A0A6J1SEJ2_FRAOC|nr:uncharacterized protein LOC113206998 isoform X1 [Frankliniella occidentalis]XP_026279113.1 uncharacterized protein LOC113206998 isoform X1 [Frankliniella occidentalis]
MRYLRTASARASLGCEGRRLWWAAPLAGVCLLAALAAVLDGPLPLRRQACWSLLWNYDQVLGLADDFEGFDNETGVFSSSGAATMIVPNIVHFLRIGQPEFSFMDYVCVLAAWERQDPDWLMFHTDLFDFRGEYWERLKATPGLREVLQIVPAVEVTHVFGQPLDPGYGKWHGGDVARIHILRKYGGIFLDNDAYLLQSLDELRRFEMSLGWPQGEFLGTQVLVAHRDARFLLAWLESYREAYVGTLWYYNAGQRPTQVALHARPELVHREPVRLGVDMNVIDVLYLERAYDAWRKDMLAVHLFSRHTGLVLFQGWRKGLSYPVTFTEENICAYNVTVLQLAQAVLPRLCARHGL